MQALAAQHWFSPVRRAAALTAPPLRRATARLASTVTARQPLPKDELNWPGATTFDLVTRSNIPPFSLALAEEPPKKSVRLLASMVTLNIGDRGWQDDGRKVTAVPYMRNETLGQARVSILWLPEERPPDIRVIASTTSLDTQEDGEVGEASEITADEPPGTEYWCPGDCPW